MAPLVFNPARPPARPARRLAPRFEQGSWGHTQLRRLQRACAEGLRMRAGYALAVDADALLETPDVLDALHRSGCVELLVEFETLGPAAGARADALEQLVDAIHVRGMRIHASFTLGFDHDDSGCFERIVAWVEARGIARAELRLWAPTPGSSLVRRLAQADRVRHRDFSRWDGAHVVIRPAQMDAQTLYRGWCWARNELGSLRSAWRRRPGSWRVLPGFLFDVLVPRRAHSRSRGRVLPQGVVARLAPS